MGLIILLISAILNFVIHPVSPFKFGDAGEFYMINEGFFPKNIENEFVKVETCLEPLKENYLDKRIFGIFDIKKDLESLGVEGKLYRESNNAWLKQGPDLNFPSLCTMPLTLEYFEKCFTGKWDKKTCTLDKGTYFLRNYTMENDIKSTTSKFPFGHWKFNGTLLAKIDGKRTKVATASVTIESTKRNLLNLKNGRIVTNTKNKDIC